MMVPEEKSVGNSVGLSRMTFPAWCGSVGYHGQRFRPAARYRFGACAAQLPVPAGGAVAHTGNEPAGNQLRIGGGMAR